MNRRTRFGCCTVAERNVGFWQELQLWASRRGHWSGHPEAAIPGIIGPCGGIQDIAVVLGHTASGRHSVHPRRDHRQAQADSGR